MYSSEHSKPSHWSIGTSAFPAAKLLSSHYQAYLEQRDMILSQAKDVLGSRDLAAQWFNKPARGLDYRPPCSVVTDVHGYRLVRDYLERIKYGVYC
ncbi:antitoxin Xre/MbcA/ParS toxin-binding domain-containing protein [Pseudomonas neuropathica]